MTTHVSVGNELKVRKYLLRKVWQETADIISHRMSGIHI